MSNDVEQRKLISFKAGTDIRFINLDPQKSPFSAAELETRTIGTYKFNTNASRPAPVAFTGPDGPNEGAGVDWFDVEPGEAFYWTKTSGTWGIAPNNNCGPAGDGVHSATALDKFAPQGSLISYYPWVSGDNSKSIIYFINYSVEVDWSAKGGFWFKNDTNFEWQLRGFWANDDNYSDNHSSINHDIKVVRW